MTDAATPDSLTLSGVVHDHARRIPSHVAVRVDDAAIEYAALDTLANRFANALTRAAVGDRDVIAAVAPTGIAYLALMIGATRVGGILAPLPGTADAKVIAAMLTDSGARLCFTDRIDLIIPIGVTTIPLDGPGLETWLGDDATPVADVAVESAAATTIIYSSGTTGTPKGIVQSYRYRGDLMTNPSMRGYDADAVTLLATPLYSNTTLASLFPTIGAGGTVVLMTKFDAGQWLALAERYHVTHAMLVPVMIDRILAHSDFDRRDLSAFRMKYCTSAPFAATLKQSVLERWPGGLTEVYGMTEGGAAFVLRAHEFPDKLHTVGRPAPNTECRILDEADLDVAPGGVGEVVGRARTMMLGYHNRPDATAECRWTAPDGSVWQRTGDIGRLDEDGFLTIVDRKKDMIISGGFNIYPADIEAVLVEHPAVREVAVIGVPDPRWGETPVAYVVADDAAASIMAWGNARLGKTQRVTDVVVIDTLPRGAIGKVLKRELRDSYLAAV